MGSDSELTPDPEYPNQTWGDMILVAREDNGPKDAMLLEEARSILFRQAAQTISELGNPPMMYFKMVESKSDVLCTMPYYGDDGVFAPAHSDKPHYHVLWKAALRK
jgi:hypothetical protein